MISLSDSLVERIAAGDETAFRQIHDALYARAVGWANFMLRQHETSEEVVSDVFVKLWRRRQSLGHVKNLTSYIYMAVKHAAIDHIRRNAAAMLPDPEMRGRINSADNPENIFIDGEYNELIRQGIDRLPERCRKVFEMTVQENLKQNETARLLGISIKTVEAQVAKAYKRVALHVRAQYRSGEKLHIEGEKERDL